MQSQWRLRALTFLVWALAAASAVYWALKFARPPAAPAALPIAGTQPAPADASAVARLLGAVGATAVVQSVNAASRYVLVGVVASRSSTGAALIAVDGKPARPFRVGAKVDEGLILQSVAPRRAWLGASTDAPASLALEMPLPKK
jgi:general secretion pathway protein C